MPTFIVLYHALKETGRAAFLLTVSLLYYAWGEGAYVLILLISILSNYLFGLLIDHIQKKTLKKTIFLLAIAVNLGLLIYFKYTHFLLANLGLVGSSEAIHLPIGISFFTFQALSFLIDIYRKTQPMDKNPVNFAVYIAMFPKLITGPIVPYHDLSKQIKNSRRIDADDLIEGVKRLVFGLGKKILIADTLALPVNKIFAVPADQLSSSTAWLGLICYTLQIYFDFSGYTDMAVGIGRLCGFRFPENFNYPYIAVNIKDFWRRWHITLAHWLRDYLFLPIAYAVSRRIKTPRLLGIKAENWAYFYGASITFLICGIWHGANWTFFVWGGYYGFLLVLEHGWLGKKMKRKWPRALQIIYCQLLVMIGWVFFRSDTLAYAFSYLKTLAGFGNSDGLHHYAALYLNNEITATLLIGLLGAVPIVPWLSKKRKEKTEQARQTQSTQLYLYTTGYTILYNLSLLIILTASIMARAAGTYNPFIYFRF